MNSSSSSLAAIQSNRNAGYCHCRLVGKEETLWSESNPSRRFVVCSKTANKCEYVEWIDAEFCDRSKEVIRELLGQVQGMRVYEARAEELENVVNELHVQLQGSESNFEEIADEAYFEFSLKLEALNLQFSEKYAKILEMGRSMEELAAENEG